MWSKFHFISVSISVEGENVFHIFVMGNIYSIQPNSPIDITMLKIYRQVSNIRRALIDH